MSNIRSLTEARQKSELEVINNFAIQLLQQRSLEDLLWTMADTFSRVLQLEDCVIYLRQGTMLVQMAAAGPKNPVGRQIKSPLEIRIGEGIVGNVALRARAEVVRDTREDHRYIADEFSGRSEMAVPVVYGNEVIAVIDTECAEPDGYSDHQLRLMTSLANIASSRIASAIESRDKELMQLQLRRLNEELEQKISERTERLRLTISQLQNEMEERRTIESELYREKEHLAATLRSIADGVIAVDDNNQIMFMSKSAELMTGRSMSDSLQLADIYQPQPVSARQPGDENIFQLQNAQGHHFLIEESRSGIFDEHQGFLGTIISFRDIARSRRKQEENELDRRLASMAELAGSVAFSFNNALTIMTGNLEIAAQRARQYPEISEPVELALSVSRQSSALPRQLSQFANGTPLKLLKAYRIQPLVEDAVSFYLTARDIACVVHIENRLPTVDIDENQIRQVLGNLLTHARLTAGKPPRIEITLNQLRENNRDWLSITITDNGTALNPEEARRLFDPAISNHFRTDRQSLAEAYGIVRRHGGTLRLLSDYPAGNTMQLLLAVSEHQAGQSPVSGANPQSSLKILFMDDDAMICEVARQMLDLMGHKVVTVSHGNAAVSEYVRAREINEPFDLVILDLTIFGGLGGQETLTRIRHYDPDARCILMTGQISDFLTETPDIGLIHRLQKPFGAELLSETISHLMDQDERRH